MTFSPVRALLFSTFALVALVLTGCARDSSRIVEIPPEAGYKLVQSPDSGDAMPVHIYELDNGLRVYLTRNDQEPRFYAEIAVRAGSKHDPPETTGLAHYFEHLMFKGSDNLGTLDYEKEKVHLDRIEQLYEQHFAETDPDRRADIYEEINRESQLAAEYAIANEIDKTYAAMGGTGLNAHTWREETVYKINLPANRLEQFAILESDRFINPVFRLFHTELETVYEEKNRAMDDKNRLIFDAVQEELYKVHPYGLWTTLGHEEDLKNPSIRRIREFFETYYVPNNMSLAISGDIVPEEAIQVIARHFNRLEAKPLPEEDTYDEPAIDGVRRTTVEYPGEEYVLLAFRTAPNDHEDRCALTILDMILDNANAGFINLNLNQQQKVRAAGSYPLMENDYGAQFLWGIPKADQSLEEVENLLLGEIDRIKQGEVEDWLIEAIVNDFRKMEEQRLETNEGRVAWLRDAFLEYRSWSEAKDDLEQLAEVTREDVIRVANKYFGDDYVAGYRVDGQHDVPKIAKPPIDKIEIDASRQSVFAAELLARPTEPIKAEYIDRDKALDIDEVADGRRLYYVKNPINGLFTMQFVVETGNDHDRRRGIAARLLDKAGTARFSPEELKQEWYKLGTDFSLAATDKQMVVTLSGLDDNFAESLDLMAEVLSEPQVDQAALDELVKITLADRADAKKDPQRISTALVLYNRFGEESPLLEDLSEEELRQLTTAELMEIIRSVPTFEHAITYTGSLSRRDVKDALEERLPTGNDLVAPPPVRVRNIRQPAKTEVIFIDRETAQAQIRVESAGTIVDEDHLAQAQLYNEYFSGGLSGIVFQELREARGLAYVAAAFYRTGDRAGEEDLMIGVIGTQPDKTTLAMDGMKGLIEDMPVQPERFGRTVESLDNRYRTFRMTFREVIPTVRSWERLELEGNPRERQHKAILNATLDDVVAFQQEHVKGRPRLVSVVGDGSRIDMDALTKWGEFREIDIDTIFPE